MTFSEAHEQISILLDKHDAAWFEAEEKDMFLNYAQNEFVKRRYAEFELNEKRRQDLRTLITTHTGSTTTVTLSTLPESIMFVLSLKGNFDITSGGVVSNSVRAIKPMQHDDVNITNEDPFNKASNDDPYYLTYSDTLTIESETPPSSWTLTYLKHPSKVDGVNSPNVEFDLPTHTHEEIVNLAVRKILKTMGDDTYNLQINEINEQE